MEGSGSTAGPRSYDEHLNFSQTTTHGPLSLRCAPDDADGYLP